MVLVLPELLAPMVVLLPLVVVSVLAVPLGAVPGVVLVVPLAVLPLLGLPLGVVVLGLPLGVVVASVEGVVLVVPGEAAAGAALESVVVEPLLLGVCAEAQPPNARAAAAASVVRVFLVVLISLLLEQNPEGKQVERSRLTPAFKA